MYLTNLASETLPCATTTKHDQNTTITASQVIIACGTGLFYLVIFTLGILGVWVRSCARLCSSQGTFFVFFIGALVASVNVFTNADNLEVNLYFRSSTVLIIGIAFTLFGGFLFFSLPEEGTNARILGRQQPSMGSVIFKITFPLFLLEAVLLALAFTNDARNALGPNSGKTYITWILVIVDKFAFFVQKPIQVAIYLYLRATIACLVYKENAQFYFRVLSFFNMIEWIDAQVNVDRDVSLSGPITESLDGWLDVFVVLYKALIIDYRLLCCLLFLEHSVEILIEDQAAVGGQGNNNAPTISCMTPRNQLRACGGYMIGCLCLTAPLFCGLQYVKGLHINGSVQISAIIVNVTMCIFGICFLRSNNLNDGENREAPGVKIMVCCLGAVGFICWIVKAAITAYWAATAHDRSDIADLSNVGWDAAKFTIRGLTAAFLMFLFMRVNARALPIQNPTSTMNHLFVPVLMSGIFSVFCETLIDQYLGPLEKTLRSEIKEQSLKILLEAGPPMYLGFLIHLFLHFFIIQTKIRRRPQTQPQAQPQAEPQVQPQAQEIDVEPALD